MGNSTIPEIRPVFVKSCQLRDQVGNSIIGHKIYRSVLTFDRVMNCDLARHALDSTWGGGFPGGREE